jgi:uracil-DNA glycosylase family 4
LTTTSIDELRKHIKACTQCHLHNAHHGPVPGWIGRRYGLMVVGEAPGSEEDQAGLMPFVGISGRYLRGKLREHRIPVEYTSYANAISCRPTEKANRKKDRPPRKDELAACRNNLLAQIAAAQPRVVLTVGAIASRIFYTQIELVKDHGRPIWLAPKRIQIPTYHPAFVLRKRSEWESVFDTDLLGMTRRLHYGVDYTWPDDCRTCGSKDRINYDTWGLCYCDSHPVTLSKPVREHSLWEGML